MILFLPTTAFKASAPDQLPKRLLVAPWGRRRTCAGDVDVNDGTVACFAANHKKYNFDRVAIDFNHNTVKGTEAFEAETEPRKVAAFGTPELVPGEGIFLKDLEWTPEGRTAVAGGHFPDLSPAVKRLKDGTVALLHSVGLCRQGSIPGLGLIAAHSSDPFDKTTDTAPTMDATKLKALLLLILGLPETASDADLEAAAKAAAAKLHPDQGADTDATKAAPATKADLAAMSAKLEALEGKIVAFEATTKDLTKTGEQSKREAIRAKALSAGKLITAAIEALPIAAFEAVVNELPGDVVPVGQRTPTDVKAHSSVLGAAASSEEARIAKNLGVTVEELRKA